MTSIGDSLRRERQRRNLELSKIAAELKISSRFLDAMEHDDWAKLPGGVFTKSFVRQYAAYLGLDAEEMVAEVRQAIEPLPVAEEASSSHKPEVKGIGVEMLEGHWQSVRERRGPVPSWLRAGLLLVALMLVCSGVYYWTEQRHRPVLAHEIAPPVSAPIAAAAAQTPDAPAPSVSAPPASQTVAEPAATSASAPAATPPAPDIPKNAPNPNAAVRVAITVDEPVWVRADVNGKYQFSGTLQAHETRNIDADGEVVLRLGNAGAATITWNGKPVGEVGPKGQIRTVQFTSGGFQIVSVPKVLDPPDRL